MARPLFDKNKLDNNTLGASKLDKSIQRVKKKTLLIITATDLRSTDARISQGLSWEDTAIGVCEAISKNIKYCDDFLYVMISFSGAGVVIYIPRKQTINSEFHLVYNPECSEDDAIPADKGSVNGYTYCLMAAIVYKYCTNLNLINNNNELIESVKYGIQAMKDLYEMGYKKKSFRNGCSKVEFPVDKIIKKIVYHYKNKNDQNKIENNYQSIILPKEKLIGKREPRNAKDANNTWSLLSEYINSEFRNQEEVKNMAKKIVKEGWKELSKKIPIATFGKLTAVDRTEIENLRHIRSLIKEYNSKSRDGMLKNTFNMSKPLNIAVFGEPGSGKSFAVKEVATSLGIDPKPEMLEFNLSQFSDPQELIGALHQVRDAVLRGGLPFVFWDEFDCNIGSTELGWLKPFLAPMQDGTFLDGQITHPIGSCVFVFAGGRFSSFMEFQKFNVKGNKQETTGKQNQKKEKDDKTKKTDFISRLMGFLTIRGINYKHGDDNKESNNITRIRRAIVLRSFLDKHIKNIFYKDAKANIDDNVLNAFLDIKQYKHGVRSMEAIIRMSRLNNRTSFTPSALPPMEQLNIHVNGEEFLEHVQK